MNNANSVNFVKAVRFIYEHIDQVITLDILAKHINLSVSSLKRLFVDVTQHSPGMFIRRLRMELAFRTLKNRDDSILEIALSAGFEDQSAFARSFKATFGYSPTIARDKINIISEFEHIKLNEPDIVELEDIPFQAITKQGYYYESAPQAWSDLKNHLSPQELTDEFSGLFIGIGHDNPHDGMIAENQVRYSAGVSLIGRNIGLQQRLIPGGKYARFHYTGKPINLGMAYHYIYGKWCEESGNIINHRIPAFVVFDEFPESTKEHALLIHVPLS